MATKIQFKQVESKDSLKFTEKGVIKFVQDKLVLMDDIPVGVRKVHTGNSNYIVVKELTKVETLVENKQGELVPGFTQQYKDTVVFYPIKKMVKRVLHNIR